MTSKQTWVISQTQLHTWDTNLEIDLNVMLKVRQGEPTSQISLKCVHNEQLEEIVKVPEY